MLKLAFLSGTKIASGQDFIAYDSASQRTREMI